MRLRYIEGYRMNSALYYLRLLYQAEFLRVALFRNGNVKRILNAFRILVEWKTKRTVLAGKPLFVRLEPSAICNLKCPGCMTPTKTFLSGQAKLMTLETFRRLLQATRKLAWRMTFYMEGEPTTNPHLFEMIAQATKERLFTSISTNFTLMRGQWIKQLFQSRLDYISVCLDGFTQQSYQKYRIGGDVSKIKAALRMMMDYKREHRCERPFVNVYSITFRHVRSEMPDIEEFCRNLDVDQLTFRPDESNFDGATPRTTQKGLPLSRCHWPWTTLQVDTDGSVFPCAISFQHSDRHAYGNLNLNTLDEIWNNETYVATREYLSGRLDRDHPRAASLPCLKCRWYSNNAFAKESDNLQLTNLKECAS